MLQQNTKNTSSREPYQVFVFIWIISKGVKEYLLLKRADMHIWQGVAGGGEKDELPLEAAKREILEEIGLSINALQQLPNAQMLSVIDVVGCYLWGKDITEIPEYAFAAYIEESASIVLSEEHEDSRWCSFDEAINLLEWESNRKAIDIIEHME